MATLYRQMGPPLDTGLGVKTDDTGTGDQVLTMVGDGAGEGFPMLVPSSCHALPACRDMGLKGKGKG